MHHIATIVRQTKTHIFSLYGQSLALVWTILQLPPLRIKCAFAYTKKKRKTNKMLTAYTHINAAIYSLSFPFRLIHIRYTRTKRTQATFYLKAVVFITNRTMCNAVAFFAERKVSVRARRGKSRRNSYDIQLAAVRHASVCASVNDCAQV